MKSKILVFVIVGLMLTGIVVGYWGRIDRIDFYYGSFIREIQPEPQYPSMTAGRLIIAPARDLVLGKVAEKIPLIVLNAERTVVKGDLIVKGVLSAEREMRENINFPAGSFIREVSDPSYKTYGRLIITPVNDLVLGRVTKMISKITLNAKETIVKGDLEVRGKADVFRNVRIYQNTVERELSRAGGETPPVTVTVSCDDENDIALSGNCDNSAEQYHYGGYGLRGFGIINQQNKDSFFCRWDRDGSGSGASEFVTVTVNCLDADNSGH